MAQNETKMLIKRQSPTRVEERGIRTPNKNDVISGRGNHKSRHTRLGNEQYLMLVNHSRRAYVLAPKCDKGKFASSIVAKIKGMDPPGRFLIRDIKSGFWNAMNHRDSVTKTRQSLREGAPKLLKEIKLQYLKSHEEAVQGSIIDSSPSHAVPTNPPDEVESLVPVAPLPQFPAPVLRQHQDISLVAPQVQVNPNPTTTRVSSRSQSQPARVMHCPEDSIVQDMLCRKALDELRFRTIQLQRLEIEARIAEGRVRLSLAEQQVQYLCHLNNVVDPMVRFDPDGHRRNANNAGLPVFENGQRRRARYEEHPYATNLPDHMQRNQEGMHDVPHNDDPRSSVMPNGCAS